MRLEHPVPLVLCARTMRRRWTLTLATVAVTLACAPAAAHAQWGDPPVMDWLTPHLQAQQWCNVSWCRIDDNARPTTPQERAAARRKARREARAERRRKRRAAARERKRLKRHARALTFVPAPEVSARVKDELLHHFAPDPNDPEDAVLRGQIESNPPFGVFSGDMAEQTAGWSARNVSDVYAYAVILLWLELQPKPTSTTTAVENAVRADVRATMAKARAVWAASDAEQQELAERIASWSAVFVGQHRHLASLGDQRPAEWPTPEEFGDTIAEYMQSTHMLGIDVNAIELTRKGIELD